MEISKVEKVSSTNDVALMEATRIRLMVTGHFLAFLLWADCAPSSADVGNLHAQYNYRANRRSQAPTTNQTVRPKPPPAEKPQKFKDLAIDTEFLYPADKDHKMFPWVKISATSARSVPTPAKPTATISTVPADTQVFLKSSDSRKDSGDKGKEKSGPTTGKEQ